MKSAEVRITLFQDDLDLTVRIFLNGGLSFGILVGLWCKLGL